MSTLVASNLPPFNPRKEVVQCANNPMSALTWSFSSCVPPLARAAFATPGGADNETLRNCTTPAIQWIYSMQHLAHLYGEGVTKFCLKDEDETVLIFLEVTALRACPDEAREDMKDVLPQSEFFDPQDTSSSLGAPPLFFLRYVYTEAGEQVQTPERATFFKGGGIMGINAASLDEIKFAHQQLQRGTSLVGERTVAGKFNNSLLFPTKITEIKSTKKAPYVCALCAVKSSGSLKSCSRCKVTYYCSRECQVKHWKSGHKEICGKSNATGSRKSIVFDIETMKLKGEQCLTLINRFGDVTVQGADKKARQELKEKGHRFNKAPTAKNVHGDKEFIVKVQPPALRPFENPWMCYDGPTRSFQACIPASTADLSQMFEVMQRDGVKTRAMNDPSVVAYKGYFMAKWEGSSVRVFYDEVVSPQAW